MENITITLDSKTLKKAEDLAKSRHCSLSQLIAEVIDLLVDPNVINDPIIGMVADEPELADAILEEIKERRK